MTGFTRVLAMMLVFTTLLGLTLFSPPMAIADDASDSADAVSNDEKKPHVVFLIAEREYETEKSLPAFAKEHLADGYRGTFVYASDEDRNSLIGIESVKDADVLFVSVRRRTLPKEQLDIIRSHIQSGKPVVGIRTANHAFCLRKEEPAEGYDQWRTFDQDVFGGNYSNHYGKDLKAAISVVKHAGDTAKIAPACDGFVSDGSLYVVSPLHQRAEPLMQGRVEGHDSEPVAWTFIRDDGGRSFYTSLGYKGDFKQPCFTKMLVDAIAWAVH